MRIVVLSKNQGYLRLGCQMNLRRAKVAEFARDDESAQ